MQALGKSFDEVIKRDKNFGQLLTKIKKAYDEYLRKLASQSQRALTQRTMTDQPQQTETVDPIQVNQVADSATNTSPVISQEPEDQKLKQQIKLRDMQIKELEN